MIPKWKLNDNCVERTQKVQPLEMEISEPIREECAKAFTDRFSPLR